MAMGQHSCRYILFSLSYFWVCTGFLSLARVSPELWSGSGDGGGCCHCRREFLSPWVYPMRGKSFSMELQVELRLHPAMETSSLWATVARGTSLSYSVRNSLMGHTQLWKRIFARVREYGPYVQYSLAFTSLITLISQVHFILL